MSKEEIIEKVNGFLIEELEIDEEKIRPEARLKEDIGIDSLDYIDIVVIVHRIFGFKIQSGELANVSTLSQFYDYVESRANA